MALELSQAQYKFLTLPTKYRAYVSGYGGGKTFINCADQLGFFAQHPKTIQGFFGISYPSIRDIYYPTMEECAGLHGFKVKRNEGNKELHFYRGNIYYGTTICRSMDKPENIIGFKIARAAVDEIDVLARNKAHDAWNKIIARLRLVIDGVQNVVNVTTTPEGFKFVYEKFKENPTESFGMVQASTYENEQYLPPDYISSLIEDYPSNVIQAYLYGQFVNLTSGTVYYAFDRQKHICDIVPEPAETILIGMDFNVTKQSAVVFVKRGKQLCAVNELTNMYDTPAAIKTIKQLYPQSKVTIYPDASGASRKSVDASVSDIVLLRQAGFDVRAHNSNPLIKDRVLSINSAFEHDNILININKCPQLAKALEQQAYDDNGMPEKDDKFEHINDAFGYCVNYEMPISFKRTFSKTEIPTTAHRWR